VEAFPKRELNSQKFPQNGFNKKEDTLKEIKVNVKGKIYPTGALKFGKNKKEVLQMN